MSTIRISYVPSLSLCRSLSLGNRIIGLMAVMVSRSSGAAQRAAASAEPAVDLLQLLDENERELTELISSLARVLREKLDGQPEDERLCCAELKQQLKERRTMLKLCLDDQLSSLSRPPKAPVGERLRTAVAGWWCTRQPSVDAARRSSSTAQYPLSRRFQSRALEFSYRRHHFNLWKQRLRILANLGMAAILFLTICVAAGLNEGMPFGEPPRVEGLHDAVRPWAWLVVCATFVFYIPMHIDSYFTLPRFQCHVASAFTAMALAYSLGGIIWAFEFEFELEPHLLGNWSGLSSRDRNWEGYEGSERVKRDCWYAAKDLATYVVGVDLAVVCVALLGGLEPLVSSFVNIVFVACLYGRQTGVWHYTYARGTSDLPIGIGVHAASLVAATMASFVQANVVRQAFLLKTLQLDAKEQYIEQILGEKQFANLERERQALQLSLQLGSPGAEPQHGEATNSESSVSCSRKFRHVAPPSSRGSAEGPGSSPSLTKGPSADSVATASTVGSLPFAWPRAAPCEFTTEGEPTGRPACYPTAEVGTTKRRKRRSTSYRLDPTCTTLEATASSAER